jgi:hypothetical protein
VLEHLVRRLAPDVADRIEFVGVHAFALRLLKARGVNVKLDPKSGDASFNTVWSQVPASSPLKASNAEPGYWKEEIDHVLKGRGITQWEVYADLDRRGRRRPLGVDQRRSVWELYSAYDAELRRRGCTTTRTSSCSPRPRSAESHWTSPTPA